MGNGSLLFLNRTFDDIFVAGGDNEADLLKTVAATQSMAGKSFGDGSIFLDAYPVTMQQLRSTLAQYKSANPNLPVVLKGDAATQYQTIMDVLELAKSLDITEIGLVTKRVAT